MIRSGGKGRPAEMSARTGGKEQFFRRRNDERKKDRSWHLKRRRDPIDEGEKS